MWSLTVGILRRLPKQLNTPGFFNSELTGDFFFQFYHTFWKYFRLRIFSCIRHCYWQWLIIRLNHAMFMCVLGLYQTFVWVFSRPTLRNVRTQKLFPVLFFLTQIFFFFSCAWWLQCQYGNIQFKHSVKMICRSNVQSFKCSYLLLNKWNMCTIYPALNWWMAKGERNNTFDGGIYLTVRAVN